MQWRICINHGTHHHRVPVEGGAAVDTRETVRTALPHVPAHLGLSPHPMPSCVNILSSCGAIPLGVRTQPRLSVFRNSSVPDDPSVRVGKCCGTTALCGTPDTPHGIGAARAPCQGLKCQGGGVIGATLCFRRATLRAAAGLGAAPSSASRRSPRTETKPSSLSTEN
jgi:hypothetical protein